MAPRSADEVLDVLKRMFGAGPIDRLPKRKADQDTLLALASALFERGRLYREDEVNECLSRWLSGFASPQLDHVTLRRALIDLRYLLRDVAGLAYRCNPAKIDAQVCESAATIDPGVVLTGLAAARQRRKRSRGR